MTESTTLESWSNNPILQKWPNIPLEFQEDHNSALNYFAVSMMLHFEFNNNPTEFNIEIINDFINENDLNSMNEKELFRTHSELYGNILKYYELNGNISKYNEL